DIARKLYQLEGAKEVLDDETVIGSMDERIEAYQEELDPKAKKMLASWEETKEKYAQEKMTFTVRDKEIDMDIVTESLSGLKIPKVAFPKFHDWGERLPWLRNENVPGAFPFTAGVFPLKRKGEDPTRQFAGEGTPERTNRRFHYLSKDS